MNQHTKKALISKAKTAIKRGKSALNKLKATKSEKFESRWVKSAKRRETKPPTKKNPSRTQKRRGKNIKLPYGTLLRIVESSGSRN